MIINHQITINFSINQFQHQSIASTPQHNSSQPLINQAAILNHGHRHDPRAIIAGWLSLIGPHRFRKPIQALRTSLEATGPSRVGHGAGDSTVEPMDFCSF